MTHRRLNRDKIKYLITELLTPYDSMSSTNTLLISSLNTNIQNISVKSGVLCFHCNVIFRTYNELQLHNT